MKKCGICDKEMEEEWRYCPYCGNDTKYDWVSIY